MAKSSLQFARKTTDKRSITGVIADDCSVIEYEDENKNYQVISIADLLNAFKGQEVNLTVSTKTDEDLEIIPVDEE